MSDSDDRAETPSEGGDDLFGDGPEEEAPLSDEDQPLSDHGLESDGDEAAQYGGGDEDDGQDEEGERRFKTRYVVGMHLHRHRTPMPKDGTVGARSPQPMSGGRRR